MNREQLLAQVKARLRAAFGTRFRGLVLYGSEARGEAGPESDIDLLLLLDGPIKLWDDIKKTVEANYDLQLAMPRPLHIQPVDAQKYDAGTVALYRNVKHEGVVV